MLYVTRGKRDGHSIFKKARHSPQLIVASGRLDIVEFAMSALCMFQVTQLCAFYSILGLSTINGAPFRRFRQIRHVNTAPQKEFGPGQWPKTDKIQSAASGSIAGKVILG